MWSELLLGDNPSPESGNFARPFEIFFGHSVIVPMALVTAVAAQVSQSHSSH